MNNFQDYENQLEIPRLVDSRELSASEIESITNTVFLPHNPVHAEVFFIFGTVQANWDQLAEMISSDWFERVILTGKIGPRWFEFGEPIAETMAQQLVSRGVDPDRLSLQPHATNTLEDVSLSLDLLGTPNSILFAAKSHHSGRCGRTLRKFFPKIPLTAVTHNARYGEVVVRAEDWYEFEIGKGRVLGELTRIQTYGARGDIAQNP